MSSRLCLLKCEWEFIEIVFERPGFVRHIASRHYINKVGNSVAVPGICYLGLESHFHADANCQTRQIDNYKRDQWQLGKHVLKAG